MTTKTINLYQFEELSDKAKEKARDWWRECESQEFGRFDDVPGEAVTTAAKLLGIEFKTRDVKLVSGKTRQESCIRWQLHVQGSGASFEGRYAYAKGSVRAIKAEFGTDVELHRIAAELQKLQKEHFYKLTANVTTDGRSVHEYAMNVEAYNDAGREVDSDALREIFRDFARWIYKGIDEDFTYRMTDENVDDAIQANEYTFLEDGTRE